MAYQTGTVVFCMQAVGSAQYLVTRRKQEICVGKKLLKDLIYY